MRPKNYIDYHRGNMSKTHAPMGSPILKRLLESLKAEGMTTEYRTLREAIEGCLPFFLEEEYPFASEYCFDHASKAALYYLAQVADDESLKKRCRGDNSREPRCHADVVLLLHEYAIHRIATPTPLMARPLFDRYEQTGDLHFLQKAYGATLAVWSCVDLSGKGYNGREWRFNPPEKGSPEYNYYRNGCFSGEVGMGLYGNLSMLKSYLVQDPDFGLVGYGCAVSETADAYTLVPQDGLGGQGCLCAVRCDGRDGESSHSEGDTHERFATVGACFVETVHACGMCAGLGAWVAVQDRIGVAQDASRSVSRLNGMSLMQRDRIRLR